MFVPTATPVGLGAVPAILLCGAPWARRDIEFSGFGTLIPLPGLIHSLACFLRTVLHSYEVQCQLVQVSAQYHVISIGIEVPYCIFVMVVNATAAGAAQFLR